MSKSKKQVVEKVEAKTQLKRGTIVDSKTSRQSLAMKMFKAKVERIKALSKPEGV